MGRGRKHTSAVKTACLSAGNASICACESVITVLMSSCILSINTHYIFIAGPRIKVRNFVGGSNPPVGQAGTLAQTQGEVPLLLEVGVVELRQSRCLPVGPSEVRVCSRRRGTQVRVLGSCTMHQVYESHLSWLRILAARVASWRDVSDSSRQGRTRAFRRPRESS